MATEAVAAMPRGEFLEVSGIAHGQVEDAAERVLSAVLEFVGRTRDASAGCACVWGAEMRASCREVCIRG
jgi:hypothetical protein